MYLYSILQTPVWRSKFPTTPRVHVQHLNFFWPQTSKREQLGSQCKGRLLQFRLNFCSLLARSLPTLGAANVTWHGPDTAPFTEGIHPGGPRPRQLSGPARSLTPGCGQAGRGRESDAGPVGQGGICGSGGLERPGAPDPRLDQAGGRPRGTTRGAHLTPGRKEGAGLDPGRRGQRRSSQSTSSPPPGGTGEGRRPGPPPASAPAAAPGAPGCGCGRETGDSSPERRNQFGRSGRAEGKGRSPRKGARTRGGGRTGRAGNHWRAESRRSRPQLDTLRGAPASPVRHEALARRRAAAGGGGQVRSEARRARAGRMPQRGPASAR